MNSAVNWMNGWTLGGKLSILPFLIFAAGIVFTAIKMVKYSEVIMVKSKFGGAFVGGALIAIFSSMPELITEVFQSLNDTPGVGVADDLGANAFSALAIAIALIILIKQSFTKDMSKYAKISLLVNAGLGFLLAIFMWFHKDFAIGKVSTYAIGVVPIFMFLSYILSLFLQYKFGDAEEEGDPAKVKNISLKKGAILFSLFGLAVFGFAVLLNISVDSMSDGFHISHESAGGLFLSMTTSLPEIVAFIALLKAKQISAALATIIGSQMFNIGVSIFGDLAYADQPLFENAGVGKDWSLALLFGLEMLFIWLHIILEKRMKYTWEKAIFPSLAVATYVIGWLLIIFLQSH